MALAIGEKSILKKLAYMIQKHIASLSSSALPRSFRKPEAVICRASAIFSILSPEKPPKAKVFEDFGGCYPDSNRRPHPYQVAFWIFSNYFRNFIAISTPIRSLSVTLTSRGFHPFRRPLWLAVWSRRWQQASRSDCLHKGGQSIMFHT